VWIFSLVFAIANAPVVSERVSDETAKKNVPLIEMALNAQKAAEIAFPSGSCSARVNDSTDGKKKSAEISCVWNGERLYLDAKGEEPGWKDGSMKEPVTMQFHKRQIFVPGKSIFYDVTRERVQVVSDGQFSDWSYLRVSPSYVWYTVTLHAGMNWSKVLEQMLRSDSPWDVSASVVKNNEGERLRIDYFHRETKTPCVLEFSLKQGGNVVYAASNPPSDMGNINRCEMIYEWEPVDGQRWRLSRLNHKSCDSSESLSNVDNNYDLIITDFKADYQAPSGQFDLAFLKLPKGTLVDELGPKPKRYRIGGLSKPESQPSESKFSEWAELLKGSSFQKR
jgi:hypothetical protein